MELEFNEMDPVAFVDSMEACVALSVFGWWGGGGLKNKKQIPPQVLQRAQNNGVDLHRGVMSLGQILSGHPHHTHPERSWITHTLLGG